MAWAWLLLHADLGRVSTFSSVVVSVVQRENIQVVFQVLLKHASTEARNLSSLLCHLLLLLLLFL